MRELSDPEHDRCEHRGMSAKRHPLTTGRRTGVLVAASAVVIALAAGGCGGGDETADDDVVAADDAGSGSTDGSGSSSSSSSTSTSSTVLEGADTAPVSVPAPAMDPAQLVGVRVGSHDGYDRVVFEFRGGVPGYDVAYLDGPPTEDGSGRPVEVAGDAVLSVRMTPASGVRFSPDGYEATYTGPDRLEGEDLGSILEVVRAGDFEAQSTWLLGTSSERPFVVSTLEEPARLIVDVAA